MDWVLLEVVVDTIDVLQRFSKKSTVYRKFQREEKQKAVAVSYEKLRHAYSTLVRSICFIEEAQKNARS
ncbi:hypothetical protein [Faecalicatena orotica]|uniref:Uncharacterized protein n=1 Tax=Faecalicatena orotica TaxID=1544 RepID=A0A2Y9CA83_9FIRM|nr:hypothetical protein [Faecalicatena orotica]PWJ28704.1 hypothetical protein A8806_108219 [Faecalicatena orotica]SSA56526.1 hypothetical protein SAMN05216536_108219 [Faecalicatena orotica]